jgi:hypothetical protein
MHEQEAGDILEARVQAGGKLVAAQTGELATIKRLQARCLEAGIPAILGPAPGGG